ncbi:MAG: ABC transporter permease subunit [Treponema sp.]|jgi:ABC-type dipeptide/oligopeptide/nickel transport system permease subunit|nr:ABC transporter permease subunit [Treponema sp.]
MLILMVVAAGGIFAPLVAAHNPYDMDLTKKLQPPSPEYIMGTDHMGRCIFSRILYAARATLGYAVVCTVAAAALGITLGMIAGYVGGALDAVIMRICDVLYGFPSLVLTLVIISFLGPGIFNVVIAQLLLQWLWYARVTRNLAQSERKRTYIAAAVLCGSSPFKIIFTHLLPNIIPQMLAIITVDFGHTILSISGYSFLGLGVQPPSPEWGAMINEGRRYINSAPFMMFWPGMMILLTVVCMNILGDNMRDTLDTENIRL